MARSRLDKGWKCLQSSFLCSSQREDEASEDESPLCNCYNFYLFTVTHAAIISSSNFKFYSLTYSLAKLCAYVIPKVVLASFLSSLLSYYGPGYILLNSYFSFGSQVV